MEWQPIDTAPLDGTEILLYFPNIGDGTIISGLWYIDKIYIEGVFERNEEAWVVAEHAFIVEDEEDGPSHWMPLPEKPQLK